MTEWVRRSAEMVRSRPSEPGLVGARIFPTEKGNRGWEASDPHPLTI